MIQNGPGMVLQTMGAYMHSKVLLVAAKLKLFSCLGNEKRTIKEIADALAMKESYCALLLNALYKMEFLEKQEAKDGTVVYFNAPVSGEFLWEERENYIGDLLIFQENEWDSWSKLYDTLISGAPNALEQEDMLPEELEVYMKSMDQIGRFTAKAVASSVNLKGCRSMLDLGCGSGIFSINFKKQNRDLSCTLIDCEKVIEIARENIRTEKVEKEDFSFLAGDYLTYSFEDSYDCIFISHNIHEYSNEITAGLFQKIYQMLNAGGQLVIHDYISTESSVFPDLFSLGMLIQKRDAHCYSYEELQTMLKTAGFTGINLVSMGKEIPSALVIAKKQSENI